MGEAEKRYIRIAKAKIEQGGSEQDHPRLKALIEEHGEPMSKLASTNQGGPLGANLVTLTLRCMCAEQCTKEPVRKKFPGSTKFRCSSGLLLESSGSTRRKSRCISCPRRAA